VLSRTFIGGGLRAKDQQARPRAGVNEKAISEERGLGSRAC